MIKNLWLRIRNCWIMLRKGWLFSIVMTRRQRLVSPALFNIVQKGIQIGKEPKLYLQMT